MFPIFLAQILIGFAQIEYAKVLSKGKGFTLPRTSASQTTKKTKIITLPFTFYQLIGTR